MQRMLTRDIYKGSARNFEEIEKSIGHQQTLPVMGSIVEIINFIIYLFQRGLYLVGTKPDEDITHPSPIENNKVADKRELGLLLLWLNRNILTSGCDRSSEY